jgi:hypothetical protein
MHVRKTPWLVATMVLVAGGFFLWRMSDYSPVSANTPGDPETRASLHAHSPHSTAEPQADRRNSSTRGPRPPPVIQTPQQFRDGMRATQEKRVDLAYIDLERELGLTPEQADAVRALEVEHFMRVFELHPVQDIDDAAAERESLRQLKDDVVALLGSRDAARFAEFDRTIDARKNVADIQAELDEAHLSLSEQQRRALIQVSIRDGAYIAGEVHTGAESYDAYAQKIRARVDQRNAKLLSSAQGVLDSRQLAKLQEIYDERRVERQRWTR